MNAVKPKPPAYNLGDFIKTFFRKVQVNVSTSFKSENGTESESMLDNLMPKFSQSLTFDVFDIAWLRDAIIVICFPIFCVILMCHVFCPCSPKKFDLATEKQPSMKSVGTQTDLNLMMQKRHSI